MVEDLLIVTLCVCGFVCVLLAVDVVAGWVGRWIDADDEYV